MRTALVDRPIDVASLIDEAGDDSCGAITVFLGCVRDVNDGRSVTGIEYSAYRAMAELMLRVHNKGIRGKGQLTL